MQQNVTEKDLKALYNAVFEDEQDFCDRFFERFYSPCNVYYKTYNEKLCSALHLLPVFLKDRQDVLSAGYIFAAATYPEYRGKGYMGELIKEAIDKAKNKGFDMIFLITAEQSLKEYYKRFGFVSVSAEKEVEVSAENGNIEKIPPEMVAEILNNENGACVCRDEKHIKDILYVYSANGYQNEKGMCIAYKAGNIAVVPKFTGDISVCSDVCKEFGVIKALVTCSASTMVLPLSKRAEQITRFNLDFMFN